MVNDDIILTTQTPAGASGASIADPNQGREYYLSASFGTKSKLKQGLNCITLTSESNSWSVFDAVWLTSIRRLPDEPAISNLTLNSTILFKEDAGVLKQVIEINFTNSGAEVTGTLEIYNSGNLISTAAINLDYGSNQNFAYLPEVGSPININALIKHDAQTYTSNTIVLNPTRKWKVFVSPGVHIDNGYTDIQPNVRAVHNSNIEMALNACQTVPGFEWNIEGAWAVDNFQQDKPERFSELIDRINQGRINVESGYFHMLTGLCSHEGLARWLYSSARLKRDYGIPRKSVLLSDVPSAVWSVPMLLNRSGIKYFAEGINPTRAPGYQYMDTKIWNGPFYWAGPDDSKVLTWFASGYGQLTILSLLTYNTLYQNLPNFIKSFSDKGTNYPYDAAFIYGAFMDNCTGNPDFMAGITEWNLRWKYPQIIVSTTPAFFEYLEQNYQSQIPVFKGDFGTFWEDGAGSSSSETVVNRDAKRNITTAEKICSINSLLFQDFVYPQTSIENSWNNILLYDEHTWGAGGSIDEPESEMTKQQWAIKSSYSAAAKKTAHGVKDPALYQLANALRSNTDNRRIFVFNPFSWDMSSLVKLDIQSLTPVKIVDLTTQLPTDFQLDNSTLTFYAKDVPSVGYKIYEIVTSMEGSPTVSTIQISANSIENKYYRVTINAQTGAITF
jgi:hypothetical protein